MQYLYGIFGEVNNEKLTSDKKLRELFREFLLEIDNNHYDARTFAVRFKATVRETNYPSRKVKYWLDA